MLGLGVALSATVATTLAVIAASPGGLPTETPAAIAQLTNWLVSVPWLFVAVVLAASSRVERVVRPGAGPAWATLAFAAAACAAMQVVGRDSVSTWTLVTRAGLIVVATVSLSLAFRQFLAGPSKTVRARIVGGVFAGLLGGLGPFAMLGRFTGVAGAATFAPIDALLSGADALLGLVLATITIRATLVYVRDFLPDFNIALETAAEPESQPENLDSSPLNRSSGERPPSGTGIPSALQVAGAGKPRSRLLRREGQRRTCVRREIRPPPARLA